MPGHPAAERDGLFFNSLVQDPVSRDAVCALTGSSSAAGANGVEFASVAIWLRLWLKLICRRVKQEPGVVISELLAKTSGPLTTNGDNSRRRRHRPPGGKFVQKVTMKL